MAATFTLRNEKEQLDTRLSWNFATLGHFNSQGNHIEQIYHRILLQGFSQVANKSLQLNSPSMILKASLGLLDILKIYTTPSPTTFLQETNNRHLLFILKAFIDAPSSHFEEFSQVAEMWIHEVCRTVLDRISD